MQRCSSRLLCKPSYQSHGASYRIRQASIRVHYSQVELSNVKAELIEEKDRSASYKKKLLGKQRDLDWFHKEARELNCQLAAKREANEHLNQQLADLHQELASRDEVLSERNKDLERAMHRAKQSTDHCEPNSPD